MCSPQVPHLSTYTFRNPHQCYKRAATDFGLRYQNFLKYFITILLEIWETKITFVPPQGSFLPRRKTCPTNRGFCVCTQPAFLHFLLLFQEYLDMIESYIEPSHFEWVLISLYSLVFVVGLTGNSLVCFAVWRSVVLGAFCDFPNQCKGKLYIGSSQQVWDATKMTRVIKNPHNRFSLSKQKP